MELLGNFKFIKQNSQKTIVSLPIHIRINRMNLQITIQLFYADVSRAGDMTVYIKRKNMQNTFSLNSVILKAMSQTN